MKNCRHCKSRNVWFSLLPHLKANDVLFHRIKNLRAHKASYDPDLLEDVEIELSQAQDTANIYSNILTGMMDAMHL
jgi:magnesium transporter